MVSPELRPRGRPGGRLSFLCGALELGMVSPELPSVHGCVRLTT